MAIRHEIEGLDFYERVGLVIRALFAIFKREVDGLECKFVLGEVKTTSIKNEYHPFAIEEVRGYKELRKAADPPPDAPRYVYITFSTFTSEEDRFSANGEGWIGVKVVLEKGAVTFTPLWGADVTITEISDEGVKRRRIAEGVLGEGNFSADLDSGVDVYNALKEAVRVAFDGVIQLLNNIWERAVEASAALVT